MVVKGGLKWAVSQRCCEDDSGGGRAGWVVGPGILLVDQARES